MKIGIKGYAVGLVPLPAMASSQFWICLTALSLIPQMLEKKEEKLRQVNGLFEISLHLKTLSTRL